MKRYVVLVLGLALVFIGGLKMMGRLEEFRIHPPRPVHAPIVDRLLAAAMPADVMDLEDVIDDLTETGSYTELASIREYQTYSLLSRALGSTPDPVATVGGTISWAGKFPERTEKARHDVMASALSVRLAAPDTVPPTAGRSGNDWNRTFDDQGGGVWTLSSENRTRPPDSYFVVEVGNALRMPLRGFTFFLVPVDAAGQQVDLPARSYIHCDNNNYRPQEPVFAPGATLQMLCDFRPAPAPFSPADFAQVLKRIRSGAVHFAVWTKELRIALAGSHSIEGLQLRDPLVSAEYGHPPSEKIVDAFVANGLHARKPQATLAVRATCEDRGDCDARLMKMLAPFEGFLQQALFVLTGMIPGVVVAGPVFALARTRSSRQLALVALATISVAAVPIAFKAGGSGWGPLAAVMILAYAEAGFWLGIFAGWIALKKTARAKVD